MKPCSVALDISSADTVASNGEIVVHGSPTVRPPPAPPSRHHLCPLRLHPYTAVHSEARAPE